MRIFSLFLVLTIFETHAAINIPKDYNPAAVDLNSYKVITDPNLMEVEEQDSQGKGQSDMFLVFQKTGNTKILKMHLFDLNRDKKIDLVKHFQGNKFVRSEADLDYDGKVDVSSFFDVESGELLQKVLSDGQQLIWKYWHKNELRKKEVDRNADLKPDMWVYYRNGKVVKTQVDDDYDGKIDP